jgi:glycosyltransferase involved in cell wall biosynthesis
MRRATTRPPSASPTTLLQNLDQRLGAAAQALLDIPVPEDVPPGAVAAHLLPPLVDLCAARDRADARWLVLAAVYGALPSSDEVLAFGRELELAPRHHVQSGLLAQTIAQPHRGRLDLPMTLVTDGALVDVDFTAKHDAHTGIHRVVRETIPRWRAEHPVHPAAWVAGRAAMRTLTRQEEARVFRFGSEPSQERPAVGQPDQVRLLVPWRSVLVLPDVPSRHASSQLAALARFSGCTVTMVGYDMIPITSAEMRPEIDSVTFAEHLTVVKHAHRIAGISRSATAEYQGFAEALAAQGLPGPHVHEVRLVDERPSGDVRAHRPDRARPVMLLTGSREPHKNQRAALHAAERLWREGVPLDVRMIGGPGWSDAVLRPVIERLRSAGHPLVDLGRVSDERMTAEITDASFVVFASLHEGYGLPVAEALACGTPVITADFGSQAEIAEGGGCLTVDPRDDDAITEAIRLLATQPAERARLRTEAAARNGRTWDEYATDLWSFLVEGDAR